ncbi:hypothetical protein RRG08_041968 [Elysia crispata]|uniref:Uncharacterized protein n=1 Tax=Elysia crispata TaxID=231223 RepID=A0AAE0ZQV5_9GAST|nr:hypothetical protein RRG08_041968 [Elysia crispata]
MWKVACLLLVAVVTIVSAQPQPVPAYQQPVAPGGYYPPPQGQPPVGYYPPPQGQQPAGLGGGLLNNFLQIATAPLRIFSSALGGRK